MFEAKRASLNAASEATPPAAPAIAMRFLDFLQNQRLLDGFGTQRVTAALSTASSSVDVILLELGLIDEHKLADALSLFLGYPRINGDALPSELSPGLGLPPQYLRQSGIVPVALTGTTVTVATAHPLDTDAARAIGYFLDRAPDIRIATATEVNKCLASILAHDQNGEATSTAGDDELGLAEHDAERLRDIASEAPTIRLLNRIVASAIERRASDIHVEPMDDHVLIRLRIDGALQTAERLQRTVQRALVSRIKILSRLNIAEQRLPQDGRIRLAVRGRDVDFRVSTSPTLYGESVVLRILDRKDIALSFPTLGFDSKACRQLGKMTETPNGIVLVTGPTGSGKTTTLYAALSLLNREDLKVFTVEDPIEYQLKGANQVLVRPAVGLDFATALRSILRQDPDVIMIGEIRDAETAKIAVQASLTGHMVLSTLHTNSAAASITRLRDIGIEDFLIVSTVRAIVAQRLVRKLCPSCKTPSNDGTGYAANGCPACQGTGHAGRTVVYEILEFSDRVKKAVLDRVPDDGIERIAIDGGMTTMAVCGSGKVQTGETSRAEIARIAVGGGG